MSSSTWVVRQQVPTGARWFSAGSCIVAAVTGVLVLLSTWGDDEPTVRSIILALLILVCLAAAELFRRSGAELHLGKDRVRLKLFPIWSATFTADQIKEASVVQVKPLPREWGWIGSPAGPKGRVVGVGKISDAIQLTLTDGRRYALTLNPHDHDLPAIAEQIYTHTTPAT